jgi:cytoskeletal protein CcmA (bactofilin family)
MRTSNLPNIIPNAWRSISSGARPMIARLRAVPCDECSQPIRSWNGRICLVDGEHWAHLQCWQRSLFRQRRPQYLLGEIGIQITGDEFPSPQPRSQRDSASPNNELRGRTSPSSISTVTRISGKVEFRGLAKIEGEAEGEITGDEIEIAATAVVMAPITANRLKVRGQVNAEIVAHERLEVLSTARLRGPITTPTLVVAEGAQIDGDCRMPPEATKLTIGITPNDREENIA